MPFTMKPGAPATTVLVSSLLLSDVPAWTLHQPQQVVVDFDLWWWITTGLE